MAKLRPSFVCLNCQGQFPAWSGRCPSCGEWNTLVEQERSDVTLGAATPAELTLINKLPDSKAERFKSGLAEFDRVLGGDDEPGIVRGSVILLAGSPGVGKSTLLLQVASSVENAIYATAEESLEQIRLRVERLTLPRSNLKLTSERDLSRIIAAAREFKPPLVVIDSIQTVFDEGTPGTPGSIVQVKELCWRVAQFAKGSGITFIIVGHVTKEGMIAGPKVLEHLVDTVLYFEGERQTGLRVLRVEKNRYGATDEVGIWQLTRQGMEAVRDPGILFATLVSQEVPGRALTVALEGSRAFLVEVQALTSKTSFGYPKRAAQGVDLNRLNLLLAVAQNRLNLPVYQYDVFLNIVGGFYVKDPGIDLAILGAVISSLTKKILPGRLALCGELGLLGEIRPPQQPTIRLKEARRLNYKLVDSLKTLQELRSLFG